MKPEAEKIDYLIIGHVTRDLIAGGSTLGGTATYSALCARNLGLQTAVLTACADDLALTALDGLTIHVKPSAGSTTFENIETKSGRKQVLHQIAARIGPQDVPNTLRAPKIVHLGPVADEIDADILAIFPDAFIGLTPQGWMRVRGEDHHVHYKNWEDADQLLARADAVVLSIEDVQGDCSIIEDYAAKTRILAVTEGFNGAGVYWHGDIRHFSAPSVPVVDPTGAGDIFAAVFLTALYHSKDPWISAKQAVAAASASVSRVGIEGVPTPEEMRAFQIEIIEGK